MKTKIVLAAVVLFMTALSSFAFAQNAQEPAVPAAAPAPAATPAPAASAPTTAEVITEAVREKAIALQRRVCGEKRETASVDINFQYAKDDLANLSKEIDDKVAEVKSEASKAGAAETELVEMNYTVGSRNGGYDNDGEAGGKYRISGRMSFNIKPADKAAMLLQSLGGKKGYRVNLNYRMNSGICRGM